MHCLRAFRPAAIALVLLAATSETRAQPPTSQPQAEPFAVTDNSFLVEEAFNQPPRVFQSIVTWMRDEHRSWEVGITQEWPLGGKRHQISYTLPFSGGAGQADFGAALVHYRLQLLEESPGRPAISPRVSLVIPSGAAGSIDDRTGLQMHLPFSKQHRDFYFHWNLGLNWIPSVPSPSAATDESFTSPHAAASVIWRAKPMFHLMLESMLTSDESFGELSRTTRSEAFTISPGFRQGWNAGAQQVVVGLAMPVTRTGGQSSLAVLAYFSYERPF